MRSFNITTDLFPTSVKLTFIAEILGRKILEYLVPIIEITSTSSGTLNPASMAAFVIAAAIESRYAIKYPDLLNLKYSLKYTQQL